MSYILREMMKKKVKEVPSYLAGELTYANIAPKVETFTQNYKKTYIDKGSPMPLFHVMVGVFALSYTIAWPSELRHMQAAEEARRLGQKH